MRRQGRGVVAAIAITSQRQSIVFLDSDANVLYAGPNTDLSAIFAGVVLDYEHGDLLYRATGHRPAFMMAAGKLAWLKDHRPESYENVSHVLPLADWLAFSAHRQSRMRADPRRWRRTPRLPPTHLGREPVRSAWPADLAGPQYTTPPSLPKWSLKRASGSPTGTPVVVAGADSQCALIGTGALDAGCRRYRCRMERHGPASSSPTGPVRRYEHLERLLPDTRTLDRGEQRRRRRKRLPLAVLDSFRSRRVALRPAWTRSPRPLPSDPDGVMAMLGPSAMDVSELDMTLGGLVFPVPMTLGGPTRAHLVRAALEGLAYALRANIEQAERVAGISCAPDSP